MEESNICPICGTPNVDKSKDEAFRIFYTCPVCGRFDVDMDDFLNNTINRNHLASYMVYNGFRRKAAGKTEYRYYTTKDKKWCEEWQENFHNGNIEQGYPVHLDANSVESWYPKSFAERIDKILLYFAEHIQHYGQQITLTEPTAMSVLFIDRKELDAQLFSNTNGQWINRNSDEYHQESDYMLKFLEGEGYLQSFSYGRDNLSLQLSPKGYARVDELQKNTSHGRSVLVAMSFQHTETLREAIRKGIRDAGYVAIFIDEVQHNDFITPELLKHIRDSKFVVVDLTHQNNGAYFEEGYAMGLGKPVIQLCKRGVQLHFDIAQKNTIMWETEEEIPERLKNRIQATIE